MTIEAGGVTTSDHIPIIVIISTSFIIKETKTIKDYNNTNWETFQEKLTDNTNVQRQSIPLAGRVTIDEAITKWMTDIQDTMNDTIPYKTINEHISPTSNDLIKYMEIFYDELRTKDAWTNEDRERIRQIQTIIRNESKRLHTDKWNTVIIKLQDKYNDPSKF